MNDSLAEIERLRAAIAERQGFVLECERRIKENRLQAVQVAIALARRSGGVS